MKIPISIVLWALLSSAITTIKCQTLPYNPTTILLPASSSRNQDIAYIFQQSPESTAHELLFLNISSHLSATSLSLGTITSTLPISTNDSYAFVPSISSEGEVSVYAGSCSSSASSELWRFTPSNTMGNGSWAQITANPANGLTSTDLPRVDFLSRGLSFSSLVPANASQSNIYVFGGMCPTSSGNATTWQSDASYSNQMLAFEPTASNTSYNLALATSRSPPIAEAGFTITGLTPTMLNSSGVVTQQQNFVLLGGHTQSAFINMSQVAIWSLPEESWSFATVDSPSSSNGNTELAIKSTTASVDSRSGHTAVLTGDGSSIIVFGGWVGSINQAADPQLAVLNLGTGFGGSGDWGWSIPTEQPTGPGIYGHGAAMLPGNVMMIVGGINISITSNSKRAEDSNNQAMFLNTTSMTWISNYTNPAYTSTTASEEANSHSAAKSNSKKVGLGVGLGLGLAALLIALIVYLWYSRRLKQKRERIRGKHLRSLSLSASNPYSPERQMSERQNRVFPWGNNGWNGTDQNHQLHDSTSTVVGYENLNSGIHELGDNGGYPIPPSRQIARKPVQTRNARGLYQQASNFDFSSAVNHGRANSLGTAGPIHPIYEADEDLDQNNPDVGVALFGEAPSGQISDNTQRYSDPFKDPPPINFSTPLRRDRNVITPSLENTAQEREREIQEWVSDWAAADLLLNSQTRSHSAVGRISPTRRAQLVGASMINSVAGAISEDESGRTASNLSDQSLAVSTLSSRSGSSSQERSRTNSLKGFITNALNPFAATTVAITGPRMNISTIFDAPGNLGPRLNQPPRSAGSGTSSFTTAHTSFAALQAEGETLLPRSEQFRGSPEDHSPTRSQDESPSSPSKSKILGPSRQLGWFGSLKRVFVGDISSGSISPISPSFSSGERSPVRPDTEMVTGRVEPRRTVSAGATLWRRKQGKNDWEDSATNSDAGAGTRTNTFSSDVPSLRGLRGESSLTHYNEDDEWDIERAVENRVVQVMFTVPKEKLRVVNQDINEDKSEAGSFKSMRGSSKDILAPSPQPDTHTEAKGKGKSRVLEMVEKMEGRTSPER
ncbi:hypothetical protein B7494_g1085 [Chlorociboria aeruginascens]|nr:hypothetical protein B7494_g1085 [Chlorociboria aeruginascens]